MSRRIDLLIVLSLAAALFHGRFLVPRVMAPARLPAELQALEDDNERLLERLGQSRSEIAKLTKENAELRIKYEIATSPPRGSKGLTGSMQELVYSYPTVHRMRVQPPEDVQGAVKAVCKDDNLVIIDLGSDSGLTRGVTLEVYRLGPRPTYIGFLRIVEVRPNEAVAKFGLNTVTVQVGDRVTSEWLVDANTPGPGSR